MSDDDAGKKSKALYNFKAQHLTQEGGKGIPHTLQDKNKQIEATIAQAQKTALSAGMQLHYSQTGQMKNIPTGKYPLPFNPGQKISLSGQINSELQRQAFLNQIMLNQAGIMESKEAPSGQPFES